MGKIFITGSADGLGKLAAQLLIKQGHQVILHARNETRARQTGAGNILTGDLSSIKDTIALAEKVNALGSFDAVIHNAGVYNVPRSEKTIDGLPLLLAVNTIAPYILTSLIHPPKRLIYLSSGMHRQGNASLTGLPQQVSYSDTKLHDVMLSMAVARKWKNVLSNAVDPGWVPTKMGGAGAPDDLQQGAETQVWLAGSNDHGAMVTSKYFHHKKEDRAHREAGDSSKQDKLLAFCEEITGIHFPE